MCPHSFVLLSFFSVYLARQARQTMAPAERSQLYATFPWLLGADPGSIISKRHSSSVESSSAPGCLQKEACTLTPTTHIAISRAGFIVLLTLLSAITLASTLTLAVLIYHRQARQKQSREASLWGRKSRYLKRVSMVQKQLDNDLRRQYHGVLVNEVENPEMGSDSPVEMGWEERVWEIPNVEVKREKGLPALPTVVEVPEDVRLREGLGSVGGGGKGRDGRVGAIGGRKSLFFCDGVGVWLPKR